MVVKPYRRKKKIFSLSEEAEGSTLPGMILGTNGFQIAWNDEKKCLCDYMGVPLRLCDAQYLLERASQHKQYSPEEIQIMRETYIEERFPTLARKFTPEELVSLRGNSELLEGNG